MIHISFNLEGVNEKATFENSRAGVIRDTVLFEGIVVEMEWRRNAERKMENRNTGKERERVRDISSDFNLGSTEHNNA